MPIVIEFSLKRIVWMLDNPDKLTPFQKEWIEEFTKLFNEEIAKWKEENANNSSS